MKEIKILENLTGKKVSLKEAFSENLPKENGRPFIITVNRSSARKQIISYLNEQGKKIGAKAWESETNPKEIYFSVPFSPNLKRSLNDDLKRFPAFVSFTRVPLETAYTLTSKGKELALKFDEFDMLLTDLGLHGEIEFSEDATDSQSTYGTAANLNEVKTKYTHKFTANDLEKTTGGDSELLKLYIEKGYIQTEN